MSRLVGLHKPWLLIDRSVPTELVRALVSIPLMLRAAAADRNKGPILDILKSYLKNGMKVLEIASGTGQHTVYFAEHFPEVTWQPSEVEPRSIHSIVGYIDNHRQSNVRVPLFIDVIRTVDRWALPQDYGPKMVDVVLNINMIHISSDQAVEGLFKACGILLKPQGMLITYGPYAFDGTITPESNVTFDRKLRDQDAQWGLRDVKDLKKLAGRNGLRLVSQHSMPANNHMLIFIRES